MWSYLLSRPLPFAPSLYHSYTFFVILLPSSSSTTSHFTYYPTFYPVEQYIFIFMFCLIKTELEFCCVLFFFKWKDNVSIHERHEIKFYFYLIVNNLWIWMIFFCFTFRKVFFYHSLLHIYNWFQGLNEARQLFKSWGTTESISFILAYEIAEWKYPILTMPVIKSLVEVLLQTFITDNLHQFLAVDVSSEVSVRDPPSVNRTENLQSCTRRLNFFIIEPRVWWCISISAAMIVTCL